MYEDRGAHLHNVRRKSDEDFSVGSSFSFLTEAKSMRFD